MSPSIGDFASIPDRSGWSRCAFTGGELRAATDALPELERLGLLDLERWRREELGGVTVNRKPDRWVRALPGEGRALFAKYRRGARRGEWLGEILHARLPRSAAAREDRATRALESLGLSTARVLLAGEMTTALGVERESFLVTEELVGFDPIETVAWGRISPALRALLRGLSERRVAVPDLYAKHLFLRRDSLSAERIDFALVDLPRVETRTLRSAIELFVRHAGALVATVPGANAREIALAFPGGGEHVERRIEERAALVRKRKKIAPQERAVPYAGRVNYVGEQPVAAYRARSARRDRVEMALLASLLPERIDGIALDVPCGYGRMSDLLRARGASPVSLDISPDMARAAHANSGRGVVGELEHLPLADRSVDVSICFRFLHHVPTRAQRVGILKQLARVSRRYVVLTWFHPVSVHHLRRIFSRGSKRFALTQSQVEAEALEAGLVLDETRAQSPYLRDLWLARFKVP
ncbi:MAG TPA: methyltransferase domain-containing protein [Planctomycetota bacterium]|nr:methyltransferase domain-containing protein [Planctomycetota bacterium]